MSIKNAQKINTKGVSKMTPEQFQISEFRRLMSKYYQEFTKESQEFLEKEHSAEARALLLGEKLAFDFVNSMIASIFI